MKHFISTLFLIYYTLGSLCLPKGDFSLLVDLPKMFQECEKTEHHGMNIFEFLTEHLVNIDSIFDAHDNDDEQRPHKPFHFSHQAQVLIASIPPSMDWEVVLYTPFFCNILKEKQPLTNKKLIPSPSISDVFRPPIV